MIQIIPFPQLFGIVAKVSPNNLRSPAALEQRVFELRLSSKHDGPDNAVTDLNVELLTAEGWEPFELNVHTLGFLIFVYSAFSCQHLYLYKNAAERSLALASLAGSIRLTAGEDWMVHDIEVGFTGTLCAGEATADDIAFIIERMKNCPVSRNLTQAAKHTEVIFQT